MPLEDRPKKTVGATAAGMFSPAAAPPAGEPPAVDTEAPETGAKPSANGHAVISEPAAPENSPTNVSPEPIDAPKTPPEGEHPANPAPAAAAPAKVKKTPAKAGGGDNPPPPPPDPDPPPRERGRPGRKPLPPEMRVDRGPVTVRLSQTERQDADDVAYRLKKLLRADGVNLGNNAVSVITRLGHHLVKNLSDEELYALYRAVEASTDED